MASPEQETVRLLQAGSFQICDSSTLTWRPRAGTSESQDPRVDQVTEVPVAGLLGLVAPKAPAQSPCVAVELGADVRRRQRRTLIGAPASVRPRRQPRAPLADQHGLSAGQPLDQVCATSCLGDVT